MTALFLLALVIALTAALAFQAERNAELKQTIRLQSEALDDAEESLRLASNVVKGAHEVLDIPVTDEEWERIFTFATDLGLDETTEEWTP